MRLNQHVAARSVSPSGEAPKTSSSGVCVGTSLSRVCLSKLSEAVFLVCPCSSCSTAPASLSHLFLAKSSSELHKTTGSSHLCLYACDLLPFPPPPAGPGTLAYTSSASLWSWSCLSNRDAGRPKSSRTASRRTARRTTTATRGRRPREAPDAAGPSTQRRDVGNRC